MLLTFSIRWRVNNFDDTNRGKATKGNSFSMGDSLGFNASGETDNSVGVVFTTKSMAVR